MPQGEMPKLLPYAFQVMSKIGISTVQSYKGAQIFEAIGYGDDVMNSAPRESAEAIWANCTLGEYLRKRGYSKFFAEHYVVPM